ncbi:MAG: glycosyltransferase family 2 protein [Moorellales bacterium]
MTSMISAVILTWNSAPYIERCLRSLEADARGAGVELELFVVDGGSSDGTPETLSQLSEQIPGLRIIELGRNLGTTVSRNMAIRESRGDYILILDSDTEILPGALGALREALEGAPRAGIAAPRLLYPDGSVQPSCKRFPTAPLKVCKFVPFSWLQWFGERAELYPHEVYNRDFKRVLRVDHCISACWLVRREALDAVGLLDERIFYAPEDVDYCLRMWLAGWEVLYVPSAEVVHHTQRQSYRNWRVAWVHAKGLAYYFRKHRYAFFRRGIYRRIRQVARQRGIEPPIGVRWVAG